MSSKSLRPKKSNISSDVGESSWPDIRGYLDSPSAARERWPVSPPLSSRSRGSNKASPWFQDKYGKRHHAFWNVPWPLCYEPEILDLDVLNYQILKEMKGFTFVDFGDKPPKRVLDLGTGLGAWILDIARVWTDTEFVGHDIVPIQPDLDNIDLDPTIRQRIRWVNGNFLQRLPFENESFDYVRCVNVAKGVPEDKWVALFAEISRVLAVGGAIEVVVENIVFPYCPTVVSQAPSPLIETPVVPYFGIFKGLPRHNHTILEELFFDVYERRFINLTPTKIVANYLNMNFRNVAEIPIHILSPLEETTTQNTLLDSQPATRRNSAVRLTSPSSQVEAQSMGAWTASLRAWQGVVGCKESMWEEASTRSQGGGNPLDSIQWMGEEAKLTPRQQFELLFERYEQEMRGRVALPVAIKEGLGWREPLSNISGRTGRTLDILEGDLNKLDRGRLAFSQSTSEDADISRQMSCFIGFKGDIFDSQ
ncbi:S-adenosyl-L-methionine-dependent methyltransferase [Serendipita vermifera]|nr:S-adenosyl-L-methionine-dependent methyltransferase [Serendipita vermifera]